VRPRDDVRDDQVKYVSQPSPSRTQVYRAPREIRLRTCSSLDGTSRTVFVR
jgi:hypothetical protein